MGWMLRAILHAARGDAPRTLESLDRAIPLLDAADMRYIAACARHRLGQVCGGSRGRGLIDESRAFFAEQGVVNVDRCLAMSAPGFDRW